MQQPMRRALVTLMAGEETGLGGGNDWAEVMISKRPGPFLSSSLFSAKAVLFLPTCSVVTLF